MHTFKYDIQPPNHRTDKTGINRGGLVILLCSLLCVIGTGAVTFSANASSRNLLLASHRKPVASDNTQQTSSAHAASLQGKTHLAPRQTPQIVAKPIDYPVFYGNTQLPEIALTFDDGPNPIYTPQILAILHAHNIKATFFDIGYLVKDFPNIVRQEFLQGHSIGNHSWSHPQLTTLSAKDILSQLVSTSDAIQSITGSRPTIFRPPYGLFNHTVFAQALQQNLTTILWNNEARDWATPGVNVIVHRVLNLARNGGIILLHDGGGFRTQTVAALPIIITALQQRGFTFVTIPRLLHDIAIPGYTSSVSSTTGASSLTTLLPTLVVWKMSSSKNGFS